jgi:hypothetical protein
VTLVLTQFRKDAALSLPDVETSLGLSAGWVFSQDVVQVNRALMNAGAVDPVCELGREIQRFAEYLAETGVTQILKPRWRFLEFFSTLPTRYGRGLMQ